ncbi:Mg2+ transporter protein CorA-like/Zinc transport protein ZntB [Penicillium malachiteum]|nr:Mg2+ transporter protein CorA-like/Zinc transport protein ZntB [Penicillium malachiteum]
MNERLKSENKPEGHNLSKGPLSDDEIRYLKSELPKALTGSIDEVKKLIQSRVALDIRIDYPTYPFDGYSSTDIPLLHVASGYGPPEIVEFLLDAGANIEEITDAGSTVLHLAARNGCEENLKILLNRGAETLIDVSMDNEYFPLAEAALAEKTGTCRFLIEQGADFNLKGNAGRTALMFAATKDNTEIIELLLEAGANIDEICDLKKTALHYAVERNCHQSTNLLLTRGADKTL